MPMYFLLFVANVCTWVFNILVKGRIIQHRILRNSSKFVASRILVTQNNENLIQFKRNQIV